LLLAGLKDGLLDAPARVEWEALATLVMGPEQGTDFFTWIRRNPLKKPDSDE
jgi:hypothetical protein